MNQTPDNQTISSPDDVERVRKIFAKDLKTGANVTTVFRVGDKERHTARSGKTFLSMTLFDKTGTMDGRIFDNVDAADGAFANDDYLLVTGKVAVFHGKPQLVIEKLEKLDPGPMDAAEFTFTPPPPGEKPERTEHAPASAAPTGQRMSKQVRQRLLNLLDDPAVSGGIEALVKHLERYIDERVEARMNGTTPAPEARRPNPRHQGPKIEHRARPDHSDEKKEEKKPEPKSATGLPKDLAFKPFNALAGATEPKPAEPAAEKPASETSSS